MQKFYLQRHMPGATEVLKTVLSALQRGGRCEELEISLKQDEVCRVRVRGLSIPSSGESETFREDEVPSTVEAPGVSSRSVKFAREIGVQATQAAAEGSGKKFGEVLVGLLPSLGSWVRTIWIACIQMVRGP